MRQRYFCVVAAIFLSSVMFAQQGGKKSANTASVKTTEASLDEASQALMTALEDMHGQLDPGQLAYAEYVEAHVWMRVNRAKARRRLLQALDDAERAPIVELTSDIYNKSNAEVGKSALYNATEEMHQRVRYAALRELLQVDPKEAYRRISAMNFDMRGYISLVNGDFRTLEIMSMYEKNSASHVLCEAVEQLRKTQPEEAFKLFLANYRRFDEPTFSCALQLAAHWRPQDALVADQIVAQVWGRLDELANHRDLGMSVAAINAFESNLYFGGGATEDGVALAQRWLRGVHMASFDDMPQGALNELKTPYFGFYDALSHFKEAKESALLARSISDHIRAQIAMKSDKLHVDVSAAAAADEKERQKGFDQFDSVEREQTNAERQVTAARANHETLEKIDARIDASTGITRVQLALFAAHMAAEDKRESYIKIAYDAMKKIDDGYFKFELMSNIYNAVVELLRKDRADSITLDIIAEIDQTIRKSEEDDDGAMAASAAYLISIYREVAKHHLPLVMQSVASITNARMKGELYTYLLLLQAPFESDRSDPYYSQPLYRKGVASSDGKQ